MEGEKPKALVWIGSSRKAMREFPQAVRKSFGIALFAVQLGETPRRQAAQRFRRSERAGADRDHDRNSYRAVYTVRFSRAIYVLHAFQKKSKRGIATPQRELELIRERLKIAERLESTAN